MAINKRIEKVYPLSPLQSGMLFHALKDRDSQAYFEQIIFKIDGNVDRDLLQRSLATIVERYEILRTVFRADKLEEPRQFVLKQRNFQLAYADFSGLPGLDREIQVEK